MFYHKFSRYKKQTPQDEAGLWDSASDGSVLYICNLFQSLNKDRASHPFMNQMQAPHHGLPPFLYLQRRLRPFTVSPFPQATTARVHPISVCRSEVLLHRPLPFAPPPQPPYPSPPPALQYQPPVPETVNRPSKTSHPGNVGSSGDRPASCA